MDWGALETPLDEKPLFPVEQPDGRKNEAITQAQQLTLLRDKLMWCKWPPDAGSLARSHGLHPALVEAEIAAEDMRRRMGA